jgi:DNA-binding NarL/FixJ family response regulator
MRTAEIANQLDIAVSTVSTIKFNIYKKMKVENILDLGSKLGQISSRVQPT